jgi:GNAT superfamily N-acetyltransferase
VSVVIEDVGLDDPRLDLSVVQGWFGSACDLGSHSFARAVIAVDRADRLVGALLYTGRFDFSRVVSPAFRRRGVAGLLLRDFIARWPNRRLTCTSIHPWMWPKLEALGFQADHSKTNIGAGRSFVRNPQ